MPVRRGGKKYDLRYRSAGISRIRFIRVPVEEETRIVRIIRVCADFFSNRMEMHLVVCQTAIVEMM